MPYSFLVWNSAHPLSSSTASKAGRGMSVREWSLDLDDLVDLVDSPPSDDPLDFLRFECFGMGFSEPDSVEPRRRLELRELPSWGVASPGGHDERCRLAPFSEFRRVEEESKDEDSVEVWRFDFGARPAFWTSCSSDSAQNMTSITNFYCQVLKDTKTPNILYQISVTNRKYSVHLLI